MENQEMKQVQEEIDKERSSGKAVWETVGIQTVSYRDPFHTGLSKRTPTGARIHEHALAWRTGSVPPTTRRPPLSPIVTAASLSASSSLV